MEVYFIRHTTPQVDKGICYGQTDLELAVSLAQEQRKVIEALPSSFDAVYSSPLKRCHLLATKLKNKQIVIDDRLMEIHFGDWEMKPWNALPKAELEAWMKDYVHRTPPKGESMLDLQRRVLQWWNNVESLTFKRIAVVTHGGVIRLLHAQINNIPLEQAFNKFQIDYGEIMVYNTSDS